MTGPPGTMTRISAGFRALTSDTRLSCEHSARRPGPLPEPPWPPRAGTRAAIRSRRQPTPPARTSHSGVTHKHLLLADDACDMCKDVADDGDIPLDAPFSAGGVLGQIHPGDRCAPAPSGVNVKPPLADLGKASGHAAPRARAGWISLDIPDGTITPVPGGVTNHHITVVYLGPDVDDDAFARVCQRAADAAVAMPGPLFGAIKGVGSFPPSDGSDGKVPAWAG